MSLRKQLMRVEIAGEQLENASIIKTKAAAKKLGDETKKLFSLIIVEVDNLKSELTKIKG